MGAAQHLAFATVGQLGMGTVARASACCHPYEVLAIERGWTFGDCDMELGMPAWFALDKWFPAIFEVQTSCGYTPIIFFNITMAEVLLVASALLLIMVTALFCASWLDRS